MPNVVPRMRVHWVTHAERGSQELQQAALTSIPRGVKLSSKGVRLHQTTMGDLLVSAMRDGLLAEGAMFNAGGIRCVLTCSPMFTPRPMAKHEFSDMRRANKDYPSDQRFFTFADFEAEMPFNNEVCVVRMPGRVCSPPRTRTHTSVLCCGLSRAVLPSGTVGHNSVLAGQELSDTTH